MPVDVMPKPDNSDAAYAAETATVTKYYYYQDAERKKAARASLRRVAKSDGLLHKEDGMADVALEEIWNLLVGNH